jgi:hypothetical protein
MFHFPPGSTVFKGFGIYFYTATLAVTNGVSIHLKTSRSDPLGQGAKTVHFN